MKMKKNAFCTLVLAMSLSTSLMAVEKAVVVVRTDTSTATISRHIYGQFSEHLGNCIYGGIWVGEKSNIPNINGYRKDIVEALKKIKIPNLRWPGGCFADEYHWRDGIGPRELRPKMVNTNWGGVTEDNSFGTNEFLNYCELLGCEPYVSGNVGSGTVEEMSKWIEYMTFDGESPMANLRRQNGREKPWKVQFFGVGNENWGCGGNMTPDHYADLYKNFATFCREYGDNKLMKVAGGAGGDDYNWTDVLMKNVGNKMWGLSLHYYAVPYGWTDPRGKGSATKFNDQEYFIQMKNALFMDEMVSKHTAIMDKYDPQKKIAFCVDEWGAWYDVEPGTNPGFLLQQNTLRDAMLCAATMNIFHKHADRVRMANIAQMVNVLQSLILTKDEKMVLTPTYYIYDMYKVHQDAQNLPVDVLSPNFSYEFQSLPALSVSASKDKNGAIHVSLVNIDPKNDIDASVTFKALSSGAKVTYGQILTANSVAAVNTFDAPNTVVPADFKGARLAKGALSLTVPAKSVITVEIK
jgi:alpha-L-arabinofuranosidase